MYIGPFLTDLDLIGATQILLFATHTLGTAVPEKKKDLLITLGFTITSVSVICVPCHWFSCCCPFAK